MAINIRVLRSLKSIQTLDIGLFLNPDNHRIRFKRHLEGHPDDVNIWLNMGVAYFSVGMFTEAEAAADYVLDHELGLSDHGYVVAYGVKAMGTLSRGDYARTIVLSEKAFELEQCHCDIARAMLAAAETGDLQKLAEASRKFKEALSAEFEKKKLHLAAGGSTRPRQEQPTRPRDAN